MKRMVLVMLAVVVTGTLAFGQTQVLSRNAVGYVKVDAERGKFGLVRLDFESMDGSQGGCLVLSNLLGLHQKAGIGRLSAYCGAVSAGCAAGAGVVSGGVSSSSR